MSYEVAELGWWIKRGLALRGLRGSGMVKRRVLDDIALRWAAHQIRHATKFKPRLLSYK